MLLIYFPDLFCYGIPLLILILFLCAGRAYRVNARRSRDDPDKKDYRPAAILLAPITWPILLLLASTLFIVRIIVYSLFLFLATFALIIIRKPFLLQWLDKIATKVGRKLLEANSFLIKLFFGKEGADTQKLDPALERNEPP